MTYGKKIELFLENGTADSLVTAELSNWSGKAIKVPRIEVQDCEEENINDAGVYFLFGKDENDIDSVYIGESESVKTRLIQHLNEYQADKDRFYWTTAVIFVGRDLNKTMIRYLENRLVVIARDCKRYKVRTKNTYQNTVMKNADKAVMEEFIDDIKIVINALGYKVLEPLIKKDESESDENLLYINIGNAKAKGKITTEGFVVLHGASINQKVNTRTVSNSIVRLREKYTHEGKVKDYVTTEDLLFSSSSAAAVFVLGYGISGPATWKNKDGKTQKEIEAEEEI